MSTCTAYCFFLSGDCGLIIIKTIGIMFAAILLGCVGITGYALLLMRKRPPLSLYMSRRRQPDFLPLDQIPPLLLLLILRQEDRVFYEHPGYNIKNIRKAWNINLQEKKFIRGGSTITQQLAKNLYFRFTKTFLRKAAELLIALTLEHELGKNRILELYVNILYFGNGVYGITGAARFYFDKPVAGLSLNQTLMIAVIPAAPTRGNPIQHPETYERLRDSRLKKLTAEEPPLVSPEEDAAIRAFGPDCLDPELRKNDEFTRAYPQDIPLINERFGPYAK